MCASGFPLDGPQRVDYLLGHAHSIRHQIDIDKLDEYRPRVWSPSQRLHSPRTGAKPGASIDHNGCSWACFSVQLVGLPSAADASSDRRLSPIGGTDDPSGRHGKGLLSGRSKLGYRPTSPTGWPNYARIRRRRGCSWFDVRRVAEGFGATIFLSARIEGGHGNDHLCDVSCVRYRSRS